MSDKNRFPRGWDDKRVQKLISHYEHQNEDEAIAEDEALFEWSGFTLMDVPADLVPEVRTLIAKRGCSA